MHKKTDKFIEKIVKKDYNNELEKVLETKSFAENVKSSLLSILYKIETAYKDYEKVKPDVKNKEEAVKEFIENIKKNCEEIKIIKVNSEESQILGNKTFLVEKSKKRIICYPIERKLLYSIYKISKSEKIIKDKYSIIDKTLSDLINVGNNIDAVEPMRDFNGYSWTTIYREIESIHHNIVYQNLSMLVGRNFLNRWITNSSSIIDYFEEFQNILETKYTKEKAKEIIKIINQISVLLAYRYNAKLNKILEKENKEVKEQLQKIQDNKKFVQDITQEKINLAKDIKQIDETLNNQKNLQKEYEKRNKNLPLEEKIFSVRILSKLMIQEREEKIKKIEKLNELLNPKKFIKYKKELENKEKILKLIETEDIEEEIRKSIIKLQKLFLSCYEIKIKDIVNKQELIKLIYEFRYYCLLPISHQTEINQTKEILSRNKKSTNAIIRKSTYFKNNR